MNPRNQNKGRWVPKQDGHSLSSFNEDLNRHTEELYWICKCSYSFRLEIWKNSPILLKSNKRFTKNKTKKKNSKNTKRNSEVITTKRKIRLKKTIGPNENYLISDLANSIIRLLCRQTFSRWTSCINSIN